MACSIENQDIGVASVAKSQRINNLKDVEHICCAIKQIPKNTYLIALHNLLFTNKRINMDRIKSDILKFQGFSFEENSKSHEMKKKELASLLTSDIRRIFFILIPNASVLISEKEKMINKIFEFLFSFTKRNTSTGLKRENTFPGAVSVKKKSFVRQNTFPVQYLHKTKTIAPKSVLPGHVHQLETDIDILTKDVKSLEINSSISTQTLPNVIGTDCQANVKMKRAAIKTDPDILGQTSDVRRVEHNLSDYKEFIENIPKGVKNIPSSSTVQGYLKEILSKEESDEIKKRVLMKKKWLRTTQTQSEENSSILVQTVPNPIASVCQTSTIKVKCVGIELYPDNFSETDVIVHTPKDYKEFMDNIPNEENILRCSTPQGYRKEKLSKEESDEMKKRVLKKTKAI